MNGSGVKKNIIVGTDASRYEDCLKVGCLKVGFLKR